MLPGTLPARVGDTGFPTAVALSTTLTQLGMTTNLQVCLDAGDSASFPSGSQWRDTSGNGYDFDFGPAGGTEPAFNGVAGTLSSAEYMSFDGGDQFTYESSNPAWVNTLHQNNALWTFAAWIRPATISGVQRFTGTGQGAMAGTGVEVGCNGSGALMISVRAGGSNALNATTGGTLATGAWQFVAWSLNEPAGGTGLNIALNGTITNASATYSSPSASNAGQVLQIGAAGNSALRVESGFRMAQAAWWTRALSTAELNLLFQATRGRFGV